MSSCMSTLLDKASAAAAVTTDIHPGLITSAFPSIHFFSVKFGRKVQYVNYLHELEQDMDLERVPIPKQVIE